MATRKAPARPASTGAALDQTSCPVCGDRRARVVRDVTLPESFGPASLVGASASLMKCEGCGTHRLHPRPAFEAGLSNADTFEARYFSTPFPPREELLFLAETIEGMLPEKGRVVDLAARTGRVLGTFEARGWSVRGVETDRLAAQWAQRYGGVEVAHALPDGAAVAENAAELVVALDLFQRVVDARGLAQLANEALTPGGVLLASIPQVGANEWPFAAGVTLASSNEPPPALFIEPAAFRQLLVAAGFVVELLSPISFERFQDHTLAIAKKPGTPMARLASLARANPIARTAFNVRTQARSLRRLWLGEARKRLK